MWGIKGLPYFCLQPLPCPAFPPYFVMTQHIRGLRTTWLSNFPGGTVGLDCWARALPYGKSRPANEVWRGKHPELSALTVGARTHLKVTPINEDRRRNDSKLSAVFPGTRDHPKITRTCAERTGHASQILPWERVGPGTTAHLKITPTCAERFGNEPRFFLGNDCTETKQLPLLKK